MPTQKSSNTHPGICKFARQMVFPHNQTVFRRGAPACSPRRKAVSNLSLRTSSGQTPMRMFRRLRRNIQNFVAPPLQTEPASLSFGLVVRFHWCGNLKQLCVESLRRLRLSAMTALLRNCAQNWTEMGGHIGLPLRQYFRAVPVECPPRGWQVCSGVHNELPTDAARILASRYIRADFRKGLRRFHGKLLRTRQVAQRYHAAELPVFLYR